MARASAQVNRLTLDEDVLGTDSLFFYHVGVFGAYLLSVYDPETETYQTISKLGTGFSEEVSPLTCKDPSVLMDKLIGVACDMCIYKLRSSYRL